jgi:uncharacterized protein
MKSAILPTNAAAVDDTTEQPVTVTVARHVVPGREAEFEEWANGITGAAARHDGFLGGGVLRPGDGGPEWHVVYRFASNEALSEWETSLERARWLLRGDGLMREVGRHRTSGLETWFELPGRTAPAPPRWKMAVATLLGILPLTMLFNVLVAPTMSSWPLVLRVAALSVSLVTLMTWVVMPRMTRLLANWLYPKR